MSEPLFDLDAALAKSRALPPPEPLDLTEEEYDSFMATINEDRQPVTLDDLDRLTSPCDWDEWMRRQEDPHAREVAARVQDLCYSEAERIARALIATAGDYIHDRELAALVQGRMIECAESMLGRTVAGE